MRRDPANNWVGEMKKELFDDLKISLSEAISHAKGERHDLRTTVLPQRPKDLTRDEIVEIRERLNCSQAVFARALNVSVRTVQSWEHGLRKPSDAALKLLTIARGNPQILFG